MPCVVLGAACSRHQPHTGRTVCGDPKMHASIHRYYVQYPVGSWCIVFCIRWRIVRRVAGVGAEPMNDIIQSGALTVYRRVVARLQMYKDGYGGHSSSG